VTFLHRGYRNVARLLTEPEHVSLGDIALRFVSSVAGIAMVLIALALLLLRPGAMTWAFFGYALALNPASTTRFTASLSVPGIIATTGWLLMLFGLGSVGLVVFALRFPSDRMSATGRRLLRIYLVLFTPAFAAYLYFVFVFPLYGVSGGRWFSATTDFIGVLSYAIAMIGFGETYVHAMPENRQRTKWVIAGFGVGVAGFIVDLVFSDVSLSALTIPAWIPACGGLASIMIPITVSYAVIHHRVVDIRFTIGRAFGLSALGAFVIGSVAIVEWLFGQRLSATRVGTLAEIAIAVCIGFWMDALHSRIDRAVEAAFFRQRRRAEQRLAHIARGLAHATSSEAIDHAVVAEPVDALTLHSGAVFVRDDNGRFVRHFDVGWDGDGAVAVHPDESLILQLQGAAGPLRSRDAGSAFASIASGRARPVVAVPFFTRTELTGLALYGAHASGADIDADELASIEAVVRSASSAYDYVSLQTLRTRLRELLSMLTATNATT
jgi:hypothetical protein